MRDITIFFDNVFVWLWCKGNYWLCRMSWAVFFPCFLNDAMRRASGSAFSHKPLSGCTFVLPSFLQDSFAGYWILGWQEATGTFWPLMQPSGDTGSLFVTVPLPTLLVTLLTCPIGSHPQCLLHPFALEFLRVLMAPSSTGLAVLCSVQRGFLWQQNHRLPRGKLTWAGW